VTSFAVVGREDEFASIHAFVGRTEPTATALVLEGEAGIGKSTLWLAGVEYARSHGFGVLLSRPAEPERELAHAGLGDLLDGLTEEVLHELAAPRRQALEAALLLGEGSGAPVDPHALAVAVRDVLHVLGERQPLLVAADDVQ